MYYTENNINNVVNNPRLTYDKVPGYYTWNQVTKKLQWRKQGTVVEDYPDVRKPDALGRVYVVHPNLTTVSAFT